MLLHSPPLARSWNEMFGSIRGELTLPPKLRELAIMSIAVLNRAEYEWVQHEQPFLTAGGTTGQRDALRDPQAALADTQRFDATERATLALTYEMTVDVVVADSTLRTVRALLPDREVIELVGTIAGYNMVSRFLVATGIEPE
jgi:alkylhydroperoxidase family enzyme